MVETLPGSVSPVQLSDQLGEGRGCFLSKNKGGGGELKVGENSGRVTGLYNAI